MKPLLKTNKTCLRRLSTRGFSLIEILVVLALFTLMSGLLVLSTAGTTQEASITQGSNELSQVLTNARSYSIARDQYVFVGIDEVNASTSQAGSGRVVFFAVSTIDRSYGLSANFASNNLSPVIPLQIAQNLHLTTSLTFSGKPTSESETIQNLLPVSAPTFSPGYSLTWPLTGTPTYTFNSIIQISPDGSAELLTPSYDPSVLLPIEIDMQPSHGTTTESNPSSTVDSAVILISGIAAQIRYTGHD